MIIGIRHAEVWNPQGVVYARLPGFHLAERGRVNAERAASTLSTAPIVAVYASPLERAVETAAILAEPHGLAVKTDDRLAEWAFWVRWEGLPWSGIRERDPELLELYAADPASEALDEPLRTAATRILEWAVDAEAPNPDGVVVGVSHEAPLTAALLLGAGRALSTFHTTHLPHLGSVRLRPGPAEVVDLSTLARSC